MAGASRLFHTIVVIGTSMGCGTTDTAVDGGVAARPALGSDDAEVKSICDCARPGTFRCKACASGQMPMLGRCQNNDGEDCTCDESIAIATPTDCAHPEQFECTSGPTSTGPTSALGFSSTDWFAFANCTCNPALPFMASQCDAERFVFECAQPWSCTLTGDAASQTVAYACACLPFLTPIK
jgi:hypothetical protein